MSDVDESLRSAALADAGGSLPDQPGARRTASGWAVFGIAVVFAAFQIYTAAFNPLSSLVVRSIHVGFLVLLAFALFRAKPGAVGRPVPWYDWAMGATGFALGLYHLVFERALITRFEPTLADTIAGGITVVLVFEAARRAMGLGLALVCGAVLAWGLLGQFLPAPLDHRPYGFDQWIGQLFLGTEGIYGIPTFVSATYLFLFILFGTFLQQAGMIDLFTDVAMSTVGHTRGGPAKVAVVSSGIMGMISGSGIANVVTVGMFTIPLMKRFGYHPVFAGAVEATASMGGQIMPPVMGAVAFIMAETLGVPYAEIAKAAAIPAVLYYATVFWTVHLEAGRCGLLGLPKAECPSALAALRRKWFLLLPLAVLIWLLFGGYTPLFAGTVGMLLTVVLILGAAAAERLGPVGWRVLFWIGLGLAAGSFVRHGIGVVLALIGLLVALHLVIRGGRATLRLTVESLALGAENAVGVGIACAVVGVIIAVMTLTGVAVTLGSVILALGRESVFLSLVLTMVTCLIFGTGIPTIPTYIIVAAIAGPVLQQLGVLPIAAHMFVFYFGIMADLTPPVALAAFAAASIAKASPFATGFAAVRLAVAGFVVPYMAVYAPELMLLTGGPLDTAYVVVKGLVSIGLWGAATIGYLSVPLLWVERLWATATAFLVVVTIPLTDEIGFALAAGFLLFHLWRGRRVRAAAAAG